MKLLKLAKKSLLEKVTCGSFQYFILAALKCSRLNLIAWQEDPKDAKELISSEFSNNLGVQKSH